MIGVVHHIANGPHLLEGTSVTSAERAAERAEAFSRWLEEDWRPVIVPLAYFPPYPGCPLRRSRRGFASVNGQ